MATSQFTRNKVKGRVSLKSKVGADIIIVNPDVLDIFGTTQTEAAELETYKKNYTGSLSFKDFTTDVGDYSFNTLPDDSFFNSIKEPTTWFRDSGSETT